MEERKATAMHFEIDEDAFLQAEYTLPRVEENLEESREEELDRYDEQILAGLVAP